MSSVNSLLTQALATSFEELANPRCSNASLYELSLEMFSSSNKVEVDRSLMVVNQLQYAVESLENVYNHLGDFETSESFGLAMESVFNYMPQLRSVVSMERMMSNSEIVALRKEYFKKHGIDLDNPKAGEDRRSIEIGWRVESSKLRRDALKEPSPKKTSKTKSTTTNSNTSNTSESPSDKVTQKGTLSRLSGALWEAIKRWISNMWKWISNYAKTKEKREDIIKDLKDKLAKCKTDPSNKEVSIYATYSNCFFTNSELSKEHFELHRTCIKELTQIIPVVVSTTGNILSSKEYTDSLKKDAAEVHTKAAAIKLPAESIDSKYFNEIRTFDHSGIQSIIDCLSEVNPLIDVYDKAVEELVKMVDKVNEEDKAIGSDLKKNLNVCYKGVSTIISFFTASVRLAKLMIKQYETK